MPSRPSSVPHDYAIGDLARVAGTKVQTIRYYELQGLLRAPARTHGNQRRYAQSDLDRLKFIRHARELGFALDDVRSLLQLAAHPEKPCAEADAIARAQLLDVERKIARLKSLKTALTRMVVACKHGDVRTCRIIETLADHDLCTGPHGAEEDVSLALSRRRRKQ
ncbi:MAG: MerR family transcriptional regulator [Burkholderiales bacterium]